MRYSFLYFFIFFSLNISAFAQTAERPWWYTLEEGKLQFRSGAYGDALMTFEDARRNRLDRFTRMEQDFILFLSKPDVRLIGDFLDVTERYIRERHETEAEAVLTELYHWVPKESLNNSIKNVLAELNRLKNYPEAEYWIGESYRLEGELALALRQYRRAWEIRDLLESPGFDVEILYKMAEVHRLRREYQEMEKRAIEIIEGPGPSGVPRDNLWIGSTANNPDSVNQIRAAMTRHLENEGANGFLTLYRDNNTITEKAHRLLGFFYYASNRYSPAAEHLMFAFLIQTTALIDEAIRSQYNFAFTTLDDLMVFVRTRPELAAFLEETEYYRTIYYLASALYAAGKTRPGRELWAFLAASNNSGEWGDRARRNRTPFTEKAVEMP